MPRLKIRKSELDDVFELAPHLRPDDVREVTVIGSNPKTSLLKGFIYSDLCYSVITNENKVICMFGSCIHQLPKGFATIWCLAAKELEQSPIFFVREGKKFLDECLQKYDLIMNRVDSRNTKHIEWLEHLKVTLTSSININGIEFIQFYKTRESGNNV